MLLPLALGQQDDHALIILDRAAKVIGWYPGAASLFGYESAEMLGQTSAQPS